MDLRREENLVPSPAQTFGQELVDVASGAGSVKKGNAEIEACRIKRIASDFVPPLVSPKRPLLPPPSPMTLDVSPDFPSGT